MAYRLAPYNKSMQIGQGFESFKQEIRAREPLVASTSPVDPDLLSDKDTSDGGSKASSIIKDPSDGGSKASSIITDYGVFTPKSSEWEHVDEPTEQEHQHGYAQSHASSDPTVTYVARSVSNPSDVTTLMGLTGGAAILAYAQSATTHGRLFNFEQYFDANINYYISIRVVTDQIGPLTTFSIKEPMAQGLNQRDRFGDTFISGFLEGGQLDALISFKLHDKYNHEKVLMTVQSIFNSHQGGLPEPECLDNAFQVIAKECKTNIQVRQVGGTPVQRNDQSWSLESLREALMRFSIVAAAQPSPIFAVLSTYDSIPTVDGPASPNAPLASYSQALLHFNTLLDAYMEFRDIKQALSEQIWGIRAGIVTFEPALVKESQKGLHFEATSSGLARAKRKCMRKMADIIQAVESMSIPPAQTVKKNFADMYYEKAIEFREHLPRICSITSDTDINICKQLFIGSESSLSPVEKQKVHDLVAKHPNIGAHIHLSPPCGKLSCGSTFCSFDFFNLDWIVAKVIVRVSSGIIQTIRIHYTNGLCTVFGSSKQGGKMFELKLDTVQKEKIVSCSLETGRVVGAIGNSPLYVTALRLSTDRASVLRAQAGNWKKPMDGNSTRDDVAFKDLEMADYHQPMSNEHIVGFWVETDPVKGFGLCRLAPIWCNMNARLTEPTNFEPIKEGQPGNRSFPSGVWDTLKIHDWRSPMERTEDVIQYDNGSSEYPLPNILVGLRKLETWGGASMRFDAVTDSVTSSEFAIAVEQWLNSMFYEGQFTWIGIPPGLHGVQAGNFKCHTPSAQRKICFPRPFSTPPQVLVWISGLDLRLCEGKAVLAVASDTSNNDFLLNITGIGSSIKYATVSWIAVDRDSPWLIGNFCTSIGKDGEEYGYCSFPEGKFTTPPTILTAFGAFDLGGPAGTNPRFGTCTLDETERGFAWKVYRWGDSVIRSATIHWLAIPAQ